MDTKSLKLKIINRLLRVDDPEILRTVAGILDLNEITPPDKPNTIYPTDFPPPPSSTPLDEDAREIQDSLDDIFNAGKT